MASVSDRAAVVVVVVIGCCCSAIGGSRIALRWGNPSPTSPSILDLKYVTPRFVLALKFLVAEFLNPALSFRTGVANDGVEHNGLESVFCGECQWSCTPDWQLQRSSCA